jgi:hypothetical protein
VSAAVFGPAFVLAGAALLVIAVVLPVILLRRHGRDPRGRAVKWLGFGIMAGFSVIGGLFIAGEAYAEPGGAAAVPLVLAWLVPLLLLLALVQFASRWGAWVLAALTAVIVLASVLFAVDPARWRTMEDQVGPVRAVAVFVLAAALGVLGLNRTALAGWLLVVVGLVPAIISGFGGLAGVVSLSVVSVIPVIVGALYLVSARLTRGSATTFRRGTPRPVSLGP